MLNNSQKQGAFEQLSLQRESTILKVIRMIWTVSLAVNLPKGHHLILVTPYEGDKSAAFTYASVEQYVRLMRELAEKNPYVSIADWNKLLRNTLKFGLEPTKSTLEMIAT